MSPAMIPPGGTLLDTFKMTFTDVSIDPEHGNAISTCEFLDAAESLTTIFDVLGSTAFSLVTSDMRGNIKKIRDRQIAFPVESASLQSLVTSELASKDAKKKQETASQGLLWLNRALDFTGAALSQNVSSVNEELGASFTSAYGRTLKPHHGFAARTAFSLAMKAVPYRKNFYAKLGDDEAKVHAALRTYLAALDKIVGIVKGHLERDEFKAWMKSWGA